MPKFYVVISKTTTNIGRCIRVVSSCTYNHSAISFDKDLTKLYAFARRQRNSCMTAGLVHESTARYMERENAEVPIKVFEFDLSEEQVEEVRKIVLQMVDNPEYMYNAPSLVSYPIMKGVRTYKAYTCSEFVATVLSKLGILNGKDPCKYTPEDLIDELKDYEIYSGNMQDFVTTITHDERYYAAYSLSTFKQSFMTVFTLFKRTLLRRRYSDAA